jgi:hypothetical protein
MRLDAFFYDGVISNIIFTEICQNKNRITFSFIVCSTEIVLFSIRLKEFFLWEWHFVCRLSNNPLDINLKYTPFVFKWMFVFRSDGSQDPLRISYFYFALEI